MRGTVLVLIVALAMVSAYASVVLAQESTTPTTTASEQQSTTPEQASRAGQERAGEVIPDQYIVVLKDSVSDPRQVAQQHAQRHGAQVLHTYRYAIEGYAARVPDQRVDDVRADQRVDYIEPDKTVEIADQTLPWGINRVDADVSSTKAGDGSGTVSGVNAYIIDTGIYKHTDLNVVNHVNFRGDGKNNDCNGHGTHVAGTVTAKDNVQDVVGVAPGATLTGVKVLGCDGAGATSGVIKGVDWVTGQVMGPDGMAGTADDKKPAIANMSLGGARDTAENEAVRNSANSGIFYSIAAMNNGAKACAYSPASAGRTWDGSKWIYDNGITTVGATNSSEEEASWSNYGDCVDIWAPGVNVRSTKMGGGTTLMSGTSMAAPHVGGGVALYFSSAGRASASPLAVEIALKNAAKTPGTKSKDDRAITRLYVGGF